MYQPGTYIYNNQYTTFEEPLHDTNVSKNHVNALH